MICPVEDQIDVADGRVVGQNGAGSEVGTVRDVADRIAEFTEI